MATDKWRPIDDELIGVVLKRISEGETLRSLAFELKFNRGDWHRMQVEDEGFHSRYARAREAQIEAWADEILADADDSHRDTMTLTRRDGTAYEAPDNEWINRSRLRVDTRKWLMSKLAPKKFSDKLALTGADGSGPVEITCKGMP
jgi:hypothetical protein